MNRLHLENRAQVLAYAGQMNWMAGKKAKRKKYLSRVRCPAGQCV